MALNIQNKTTITANINPLSNPKGVRLLCELCGKVAFIQCPFCRVTYYCSTEHQGIDWNGIHVKICQILSNLRASSMALGSEEERQQRRIKKRESQKSLLELTRQEALKLLHEGQHDLAIPAALQSLKFSVDFYGAGSLHLVPSYLLLGEASIGLARYSQAESYLSAAKWAVLKKSDCPNSIKSKLHRIFGKLYASVGKSDQALEQLAHDIYYSSLDFGPLSFHTCGGYFALGNVFATQKKNECALSMYEKVTEICQDYIASCQLKKDETGLETIDGAQQAELLQMLQTVLLARIDVLGPIHTSTGEAYHVLGLLYMYMKNFYRGRENLQKSTEIFADALGEDHPTTRKHADILEFASKLCYD